MKIITSILIVLYMLNAVAAQMETAVILKAEAPGTFFIQGEPLKFTLTLPEKKPPGSCLTGAATFSPPEAGRAKS